MNISNIYRFKILYNLLPKETGLILSFVLAKKISEYFTNAPPLERISLAIRQITAAPNPTTPVVKNTEKPQLTEEEATTIFQAEVEKFINRFPEKAKVFAILALLKKFAVYLPEKPKTSEPLLLNPAPSAPIPHSYITRRAPTRFGGQQQDYVARSEKTVLEGVNIFKKALSSQENLQKTFFLCLDFMAKRRREIAIDHNTYNAESFGQSRLDSADFSTRTHLTPPYHVYGNNIVHMFMQILEQNKNKEIINFEDSSHQKKCRIEIEKFSETEFSLMKKDKKIDLSARKKLKKLKEIQDNPKQYYEIIKEIQDNNQEVMNYLKLSFFSQERNILFKTPTNSHFIGKLSIEIDNRMYPLSEYFISIYEDPNLGFLQKPEDLIMTIIHQDALSIKTALNLISRVYEKALQWNPSTEPLSNLIDQIALFRYLFAHAMPFARGSASIGEWLEKTLYKVHGIDCAHNPNASGDLAALTAPTWGRFRKEYEQTVVLSHLGKQINSSGTREKR